MKAKIARRIKPDKMTIEEIIAIKTRRNPFNVDAFIALVFDSETSNTNED